MKVKVIETIKKEKTVEVDFPLFVTSYASDYTSEARRIDANGTFIEIEEACHPGFPIKYTFSKGRIDLSDQDYTYLLDNKCSEAYFKRLLREALNDIVEALGEKDNPAAALGAKGGASKSATKRAAAQANGAKGGRPQKLYRMRAFGSPYGDHGEAYDDVSTIAEGEKLAKRILSPGQYMQMIDQSNDRLYAEWRCEPNGKVYRVSI